MRKEVSRRRVGLVALPALLLTLLLAASAFAATGTGGIGLSEPPCSTTSGCGVRPAVDNPDPETSVLVIGVGWDGPNHSPVPKENASFLSVEANLPFLNGTFDTWEAGNASGLQPAWQFSNGGEYKIAEPRNAHPQCSNTEESEFIDDLESEARQAAEGAGFHPAGYAKVIVYYLFQKCSHGGLTSSSSRIVTTDLDHSIIYHEFGHSLGFAHAELLHCVNSAGAVVPLSGNCTHEEYGDRYDVMGTGIGSYDANDAYRAGWLNGQFYSTGESLTTRTYSIAPLTQLPHAERAIKLTDGGQTFWIEYRRHVGTDAKSAAESGVEPEYVPGVVISRANAGRTERINVSGGTDPKDNAFRVGQSWADPLGTQIVTLLAESPSYATIRISSQLVAVPNILGQTTTQARTTLQNVGLTLGSVEERADPRCESLGRVWTQNPGAGAGVRPGTSVSVSIGKKDKTHECP
jgi:hypothetical protein